MNGAFERLRFANSDLHIIHVYVGYTRDITIVRIEFNRIFMANLLTERSEN